MAAASRATTAPTMTITPRRGFFHLDLGELWRYRELGFFLAWRDVKVRYKQTVIGAAWAIIQPVVLMIVFSAVFRRGGRLAPPSGIPAPIFYFSALVAWSYFAQALQVSTGSVVSQQQVVTRVYFPRLILPLEGCFPGLVDFTMSFLVMLALMVGYHVPITGRLVVLPPLLILAMLTAFGAGMWLSASNALYRDIREGIPFLIQVLMLITVVLPSKRFAAGASEGLRWLYGVNPMAGVIEGFRWAIIGRGTFPTALLVPGMIVTAVLLLTGVVYFRRIEDVIVDVV